MAQSAQKDQTGNSAQSRREERRAAQNEMNRAHVLDAAEDVFSRKGFHEATIKEIAEAAEFSVGAVYSFFENKDDLFLRVLDRRGTELVPQMKQLLDGEGSPPDQLHALADFQVQYFRDHPNFARLFVRATGAPLLNIKASLGKKTREQYDLAMSSQADLFRRGQDAGTLMDGPPQVLAEIYSGIVLAFQSHDPLVVGDDADGIDRAAMSLESLHELLERSFVVPGRPDSTKRSR